MKSICICSIKTGGVSMNHAFVPWIKSTALFSIDFVKLSFSTSYTRLFHKKKTLFRLFNLIEVFPFLIWLKCFLLQNFSSPSINLFNTESNIKAMHADKNDLDIHIFIYTSASPGVKKSFFWPFPWWRKKTRKLFQFIVCRWE